MGPVAQQVFKTCAVWQPHARSVRLRRRSVWCFGFRNKLEVTEAGARLGTEASTVRVVTARAYARGHYDVAERTKSPTSTTPGRSTEANIPKSMCLPRVPR